MPQPTRVTLGSRTSIPRCPNPDIETFAARFGRPGLPVVIPGAANAWPARDTWTLDGLAARFSQVPVRVTRNDGPNGAMRDTTFGEYARYCREQAAADAVPWYLTSWRFTDHGVDLLSELEIPVWFRDNWLFEVSEAVRPKLLWMFIGPARAGSWLHLDIAHSSAWNVQVTGCKRWIMFPPGQDDCMYEGHVNALTPDLSRFPRFAKARACVADVGPGDLVYTPTGWWHQTINLDEGIAVTGNLANAWNWEAVAAWLDAHPGLLEAEGLAGLAAAFRDVADSRR